MSPENETADRCGLEGKRGSGPETLHNTTEVSSRDKDTASVNRLLSGPGGTPVFCAY